MTLSDSDNLMVVVIITQLGDAVVFALCIKNTCLDLNRLVESFQLLYMTSYTYMYKLNII